MKRQDCQRFARGFAAVANSHGAGDRRLGRGRNGRSKGYLVHETWFFLRF